MKYQRKKILIDSRLQGRLILSMVLIEILILITAMFYLNHRFSVIIEHDLYAIHRSSQHDMLSAFAELIGWVIFGMGLLNAVMLFIAHYIWSQQLSSVMHIFRNVLHQIRSLQLTPVEQGAKPVHELLILLDIWYSKERGRIKAIKQEIALIKTSAQYQDSDLQSIKNRVNHCLKLLGNPQAKQNN